MSAQPVIEPGAALTVMKPDRRVRIEGDLCVVTFDRFDLDSYQLFLKSKLLPEHSISYDWRADTYTLTTAARFAPMLGFDVPGLTGAALPLAPHLFDYQQWAVDMALKARRFSLWLDCVAGDTLIQGPDGDARIDELAAQGKPIRVWSLTDDGQVVPAWASTPFVKGRAMLYEFTLASGRSITVTERHHFLTPRGWQPAGSLRPGDRLSVHAFAPSTSPVDARSSEQTPVGSMGRCSGDCRRYGLQPRWAEGSGLTAAPSQADALSPARSSSHTDGPARRPAHTHHHRSNDRLSTPGYAHLGNCTEGDGQCHASAWRYTPSVSSIPTLRLSGQDASPEPSIRVSARYARRGATGAADGLARASRSDGAVSPADASIARQAYQSILDALLSLAWFGPAQSTLGFGQHTGQFETASFPPCDDTDTIVSIQQKGENVYYDLHVPKYQNYLANGIWNHNTGLGKMACALEWARQVMAVTGGRVLILAPVVELERQYIEEAARFYGDDLAVEVIPTRDALIEWLPRKGKALGIATYHKFIPGQISELRHLAGIVADESSILKTGGGVIKWNLIKSARGIQYKLSMTATPAPNEAMEYASQASFLEKLRSENEVIWTFFTDDKYGNWRIKAHARDAFYRFLASWSLYMRNPAAFGFADILSTLPAPEISEERIALTEEQQQVLYREMAKNGQGMLVDDRISMTVRSKLLQAARGFRYEGKGSCRAALRIDSHKPARVAEWTRQQVAEGRQTLIWTTFDEEGAILTELLSDAPFTTAILDGGMNDEERGAVLARFRAGDVAVLISKPQLIGYGLNLQFVKSMCFSGFDDSFERVYQATRRAVRFGQTEQVRVFIPYVPELEGLVFSNIRRKESRFMEDVAAMEAAYITALKEIQA